MFLGVVVHASFPYKGHLNIKKKEGQSQFWLWLALHSLHESFQIINPTQEKAPIHIPVAKNKFQKHTNEISTCKSVMYPFFWRKNDRDIPYTPGQSNHKNEQIPSKKGTSPFWMHMVSFFGKGCKPFRVPQKKNRLEIKHVRINFHSNGGFSIQDGERRSLHLERRILHSERRFLHSEWRKRFGKHIYRFFKKERFETLLKKFEWRNLHSKWRFLHSEWRKCSGKKRDKFQKKGSKRFWKSLNGEISILNGDFSILNGENALEKKRYKCQKKDRNASKKVWMEKSPFRIKIPPFWMEKMLWKKKEIQMSKKGSKRFWKVWMEKSPF